MSTIDQKIKQLIGELNFQIIIQMQKIEELEAEKNNKKEEQAKKKKVE